MLEMMDKINSNAKAKEMQSWAMQEKLKDEEGIIDDEDEDFVSLEDIIASAGNASPTSHEDFRDMSTEDRDEIINPKHYKMVPPEAYTMHPRGMEYIDLMSYLLEGHRGAQAHLLGQIYKYSCRLGKKDSRLQDASKIAWYANRLVAEIEHRGED